MREKLDSLDRVLITAVLMAGIYILTSGIWVKVLSRFAIRQGDVFYAPGLLLFIIIPLFSPVISGVIATRLLGSRWPEPAFAAALASSVFTGLTFAMLSYWIFIASYWIFIGPLENPVLSLSFYSAGIFILPLFDPVVREEGPAPSFWKVGVTSIVVLPLSYLGWMWLDDGIIYPRNLMELGLAALEGISSGLVISGLGLFITLIGVRWKIAQSMGAWLGSLGLLTAFIAFLSWLITGAPIPGA